MSAKAPNTRKKYKYTFKNFRKLCISHNVSFCPSSDFHVALYLIHLKNLGKVTGSIDEAFNAISWAYELAGLLDPCGSNLTKTVRAGCSRSIGRKVCNKKLSITPAILKKLC